MSSGTVVAATVTVTGQQQLAVRAVTSLRKVMDARVVVAASQTVTPGAVNR